MIAAADHGDDPANPPPFELTLFWDAQVWRALPDAGGMLDQRVRLMRTMTAAHNAYTAARAYAQAPAGGRAKWRTENAGLDDVLADVERMKQWQMKNSA